MILTIAKFRKRSTISERITDTPLGPSPRAVKSRGARIDSWNTEKQDLISMYAGDINSNGKEMISRTLSLERSNFTNFMTSVEPISSSSSSAISLPTKDYLGRDFTASLPSSVRPSLDIPPNMEDPSSKSSLSYFELPLTKALDYCAIDRKPSMSQKLEPQSISRNSTINLPRAPKKNSEDIKGILKRSNSKCYPASVVSKSSFDINGSSELSLESSNEKVQGSGDKPVVGKSATIGRFTVFSADPTVNAAILARNKSVMLKGEPVAVKGGGGALSNDIVVRKNQHQRKMTYESFETL